MSFLGFLGLNMVCLTLLLQSFISVYGEENSFYIKLGGNVTVLFSSFSISSISMKNEVQFSAHLPGFELIDRVEAPTIHVNHVFQERGVDLKIDNDSTFIQIKAPWKNEIPPDFVHFLYGITRKYWLSNNIYPVHGACVGRMKEGNLIIGHSGCGKTSTVLNSVSKHGFKVFSGDKTLVYFGNDGILYGKAGTRTITLRMKDKKRWNHLPKIDEHVFDDRFVFKLTHSEYFEFSDSDSSQERGSTPIRNIYLLQPNSLPRMEKLSPLSALHTIYPFFLDKQREDTVIGDPNEKKALFNGNVSEEVKKKLMEDLSNALENEKIRVFRVSGSLDEINSFIDQSGSEPEEQFREANDVGRVLFGVCGIGNGHINRQLPVIEHLLDQGHEIMIFTYGNGLDFFRNRFVDGSASTKNEKSTSRVKVVSVLEVANPYYVGYEGEVDFEKTYYSESNQNVEFVKVNALAMSQARKIWEAGAAGRADLVVSDYEMVSAMYSYAKNIPLITLDQQSKFLVGQFRDFLDDDNHHSHHLSYFDEVERLSMFFPRAEKRIAVSFFDVESDEERGKFEVEILPPIIRSEVTSLSSSNIFENDNNNNNNNNNPTITILVYISSQQFGEERIEQKVDHWNSVLVSSLHSFVSSSTTSSSILQIHIFIPRTIQLPLNEPIETDNNNNIRYYHHGDNSNFLSLLSRCDGIVTTSGHTLISEAMVLKKPVYAIPIPGLYEQRLNAKVISKYRFGVMSDEIIDEHTFLNDFLPNLKLFRDRIIKNEDHVLLFGDDQQQQQQPSVLERVDSVLNSSILERKKKEKNDKFCFHREKKKVLLNAEPFGFGPSAAIHELFPYFFRDESVSKLSYIGTGHTLNLQKKLPYDEIFDYSFTTNLYSKNKDNFMNFLKDRDYDVLITACDYEVVEWVNEYNNNMKKHNSQKMKIMVYDPLAWYWPDPFPFKEGVDFYIAQNFFGVEERLRKEGKLGLENYIIVPPIVSSINTSELREEEKEEYINSNSYPKFTFLVNLGGLSNPFFQNEEIVSLVRTVFRIVVEAIDDVFSEDEDDYRVYFATSEVFVDATMDICDAKTYTPREIQDILSDPSFVAAVMTSGLGNIMEASYMKRYVIWIPPENDSQGKQIRLLEEHGMVDYSIDWDDLMMSSSRSRIDYFGASQGFVMEEIMEMNRMFVGDTVAQNIFRRLIRDGIEECLERRFLIHEEQEEGGGGGGDGDDLKKLALHNETPKLSKVVEMFRMGGAKQVANSFHKAMNE